MNKTITDRDEPAAPDALAGKPGAASRVAKAGKPGQLGAVILAAGYAHRVDPADPALRLGEQSLVERAVSLFREAGVADVLVLVGRRGHEQIGTARRAGAIPLLNPHRKGERGSSVPAGTGNLPAHTEAIFVLPALVPLVRRGTISRLIQAHSENTGRIIHPVFTGRRGHPLLVPRELSEQVTAHFTADELGEFLGRYENRAVEVAVPDGNILFQVETPPDFAEMRRRWNKYDIPTIEECISILKDIYPVPDRVFEHGRAAAVLAEALGEELNRAGTALDLDLIMAGAWLHDLAKNQPDHAAVGGRLLRDLGFDRTADIVATHSDLDNVEDEGVNESEVVYLADKLLRCDRVVSLNSRFQIARDRFSGNPDIVRAIESRFTNAVRVKTKIERILGRSVERIMAERDPLGERLARGD